jgi:hypothetical protein
MPDGLRMGAIWHLPTGRGIPHPLAVMRSFPIEPDADEPIATSHLAITVPLDAARSEAAVLLGQDRSRWLGERIAQLDDDRQRHLLDLELRVRDKAPRMRFQKAALVDVGPIIEEPATRSLAMSISWRAAGVAPLFPVFAGTLRWTEGRLRLDGVYAPPGGALGYAVDRAVLRAAAHATARRLLEKIAQSLARSA